MRTAWRVLVLGSLISFQALSSSGAVKNAKVAHEPGQPSSGQVVKITATGAAFEKQSDLTLQYQLVEPGNYIERSEPGFANGWVSIPMQKNKQPTDGYGAELPASLQKHRRLIRYRISARGKIIAPDAADSQGNFAYFVYDGVPAWKAAINPASTDPTLKKVVTFSPEVMGSVQVYQFLAKKDAVEKTTWYEPSNIYEEQSRHGYKYTGTLIANGKVYDHVRFRARGGEWRHAMGKNMWKFDFERGHHLAATDDFGQPYKEKWGKLNLGACIQQGNYQTRGEHGLFEAATFRLFNLVGVPAPNAHYVHLRIIDEAEENPTSQFEGDFWGLYLATEEVDGHFLDEHGLPKGNIYKWDFGRPKPEYVAPGAVTNRQDVLAFISGYSQPQTEDWWKANVDMGRYFSYRSIVECVHHYDISGGKNYFYYLNPSAKQWVMLPWDVDLTWRDYMYGGGQEPFYRAGVLRKPQFMIAYQNRLREIRDLLFNPQETGALLDELAAVIADPAGGRSFVEADRARWDYHPIMASRWTNPRKAGQGKFYEQSATHDFPGMVKMMKDYVVSRRQWCDATLLGGHDIPGTASIKAEGRLDDGAASLRAKAVLPGSSGVADYEWRLAEVSKGSAQKPVAPRKYEITALWQGSGKETADIPKALFKPGHTYRIRARARDAEGRCGHWSEPIEFTAGK
ncbi:MAG: hypothetical protein JWM16_4053 [Verrucomicrobiales bacterium]|nr:hypothetical protein [Verrucomicrobiales bacterium]